MSVVNRMLRDLQERQEPVKQLPLQSVSTQTNRTYAILWISGLGVVLTGLYFGTSSWNLVSLPNGFSTTEFVNSPVPAQSSDENKEEIRTIGKNENESIEIELKTSDKPAIQQTGESLVAADPIEKTLPVTIEKVSSVVTATKPVDITVVNKQAPLVEELPQIKTKEEHLAVKQNKLAPVVDNTEVKTQSQLTILYKKLDDIKSNYPVFGLQQTKESLKLLLSDNPGFHAGWLYLIKLVWQAQDQETHQILHQAMELNASQPAFRLAAARYYLEQNELIKAEQVLMEYGPKITEAPDLLQVRAVIRQKLNKHSLAITDYTSILKNSPDRGDIYIALGISLDAVGLLDQAKLSFNKALRDSRLSTRQLQFIKDKLAFYQG